MNSGVKKGKGQLRSLGVGKILFWNPKWHKKRFSWGQFVIDPAIPTPHSWKREARILRWCEEALWERKAWKQIDLGMPVDLQQTETWATFCLERFTEWKDHGCWGKVRWSWIHLRWAGWYWKSPMSPDHLFGGQRKGLNGKCKRKNKLPPLRYAPASNPHCQVMFLSAIARPRADGKVGFWRVFMMPYRSLWPKGVSCDSTNDHCWSSTPSVTRYQCQRHVLLSQSGISCPQDSKSEHRFVTTWHLSRGKSWKSYNPSKTLTKTFDLKSVIVKHIAHYCRRRGKWKLDSRSGRDLFRGGGIIANNSVLNWSFS